MGYNTIFKGTLKFTTELTAGQLAHLKGMCDEDFRDHPEWESPDETGFYYVDIKITDDFSGIAWQDETEKTYNMVGIVNFVIAEMKKIVSDFGLEGELQAQGEDVEDRWILKMVDGKAVKIENPLEGQKITCPHCDEAFYWEGDTK